jgi:hypothetical protein
MIKISQSFLKEYAKYKSGDTCGLQVKAKYIDGVKFPSSDAMEYGNAFEYLATGSIPRDGHIPEIEKVYVGTKRESISAQYQRIIESAELFKKIVKHYEIEIIDIGKVSTEDGMTGIMDIVANWDDRICIIDTKYSGVIDDKWSEFGWNIDALPEKHNLMIQAVHYKLLLAKELNCDVDDIDFYFFVFSSKNVHDVKLIKVHNEENTFATHLSTVEWLKRELTKPIEQIFKAKPTLQRCFECPISDKCVSKVEIPHIDEIVY